MAVICRPGDQGAGRARARAQGSTSKHTTPQSLARTRTHTHTHAPHTHSQPAPRQSCALHTHGGWMPRPWQLGVNKHMGTVASSGSSVRSTVGQPRHGAPCEAQSKSLMAISESRCPPKSDVWCQR